MQFIGLFPRISFSSLFSFHSFAYLDFTLLCCESSLVLLGLLELLFIYLASKECQWLSSVGCTMSRWRQQPAMEWSQKATGFIYYSVPQFRVCWLQNSSSICQLLLPRLKRGTVWPLLYFPHHIIDITQSPLNSVPTNFTGLQGTWQGLHTQQQEMHMSPPLTQPHFSPPPPPRTGRLFRPCCLLKLWVNILW